MEVSHDQVAKWIDRPLIEPSVADNLRRLLGDCDTETRENNRRVLFNQSRERVSELLPYKNEAFTAMIGAIDRLVGRE